MSLVRCYARRLQLTSWSRGNFPSNRYLPRAVSVLPGSPDFFFLSRLPGSMRFPFHFAEGDSSERFLGVGKYGSVGRPSSTNVLCLDVVGRDSWDREHPQAVFLNRSPQELGEEALADQTRRRRKNGASPR